MVAVMTAIHRTQAVAHAHKASRAPSLADKGRKALVEYLRSDLGNPASQSQSATAFRREIADPKATLRLMFAQASRWSPTAKGWERQVDGGKTTYTGSLADLYTELTVSKTGRISHVFVEID